MSVDQYRDIFLPSFYSVNSRDKDFGRIFDDVRFLHSFLSDDIQSIVFLLNVDEVIIDRQGRVRMEIFFTYSSYEYNPNSLI